MKQLRLDGRTAHHLSHFDRHVERRASGPGAAEAGAAMAPVCPDVSNGPAWSSNAPQYAATLERREADRQH